MCGRGSVCVWKRCVEEVVCVCVCVRGSVCVWKR